MGYSKSVAAIDRVRSHLNLLKETTNGILYLEAPIGITPEKFLYQIREGLKVAILHGNKEFAAVKSDYTFTIVEREGKRLVQAERKSNAYSLHANIGNNKLEAKAPDRIVLPECHSMLSMIGAVIAHKYVERIEFPNADLDDEDDKDLKAIHKFALKNNWYILYKGGPLIFAKNPTIHERRELEWNPPIEPIDLKF